jgi:hypothetical protein
MEFPDDENGDALRNMQASGDDLSKARAVDFSVVFDEVAGAREFKERIASDDIDVVIHDDAEDVVDVTVSVRMVPTHAAISEFEAKIDHLASPLGGRNDGWGSFAVK